MMITDTAAKVICEKSSMRSNALKPGNSNYHNSPHILYGGWGSNFDAHIILSNIYLQYYICGLMRDLLCKAGDKNANVMHLGFKPDKIQTG